MSKMLRYGLAFAAGVFAGVVGSIVVEKVRGHKEEVEEVERPELLYFQRQKEENVEADLVEPESEDIETVKEIVNDNGYAGDSEEEESKEEPEEDPFPPNKIEIISKKEYEDNLDGFDRIDEPYQYFPDEDLLTDGDGDLLEPMGYYVGDRFDKIHFQTNEWDEIYIKNYGLNEKYKIIKQREITKEDFFNY